MREMVDFEVEGDVTAVECDVYAADLEIVQTEGDKLCVLFQSEKNINVAFGDGTLFITQKKRRLFAPKQSIEIRVPSHTVPSLRACGKVFNFSVQDGIYKSFNLNCEGGRAALARCAFESAEIMGGGVDASFADCTVKNGLYLNLDKGGVLLENCFATRCECRVRHGHIGLVKHTARECVAEVEKGTVNAEICGNERDFAVVIRTKDGQTDRNNEPDSAKYNLALYSANGNVSLDFTEDSTAEIVTEQKADAASAEDGELCQ